MSGVEYKSPPASALCGQNTKCFMGCTYAPNQDPNDNITASDDDCANAITTMDGLKPLFLTDLGKEATGLLQNKLRQQSKQLLMLWQKLQKINTYWTKHMGMFFIPDDIPPLATYKNKMRSKGLALHHPATQILEEYTNYGCPTQTGKPWTKQEMWEAVARGPHQLALLPEAIEHFRLKAIVKVDAGQAVLVKWDDIKNAPPPQLKILPIAAIPHKSKEFRSILDLSFRLQLSDGSLQPSVDDTTIKTAPCRAIDQLGHSLAWMINTFAEAKDDKKIVMAKWDVKDGFWRMDCPEGEQRLCICPPPTTGQSSNPSHAVVAADGVGRIAALFLCGNQNEP
jgi:hypothetical protein